MSESKALLKTVRDIQLAPTGFEKITESVIAPAGITRRDDLLMQCDCVEVISTPAAQQVAANVLSAVSAFLNEVETGRKILKDPFLRFGQKIDEDAKSLVKKILEEKERLKKLLAGYQVKLERDAYIEQERQNAEIARLEAEKAALQAAPVTPETIKKQDAINREIGQNLNPVEVEKPTGVAVQKLRCFVVEDIAKLYLVRPDLCKIEPRTADINAAIRADEKLEIPGLKITWETKVNPSSR